MKVTGIIAGEKIQRGDLVEIREDGHAYKYSQSPRHLMWEGRAIEDLTFEELDEAIEECRIKRYHDSSYNEVLMELRRERAMSRRI